VPESVDQVRDGLTSVTRGTLITILGTLASIGLAFVARVVLIRKLGPNVAAWGTFSLGLTIVGLLSAVATLGLPQAVARNLAFLSSPGDRRGIVRGGFLYLLPTTAVVSLALFVVALYIGPAYNNPQLGLTLEFFAGIVALGVPTSLVVSIFQGYEDALPNAIFVQVLNPALFMGFLLLVGILLPPGELYVGALSAYLVAAAVVLVLLVAYSLRRLPRLLPPVAPTPGIRRRLLTFALPLLVVAALTSVSGSADTVLLGILHFSQVGYYTATLSLARLLGIGLGALGYIFLPVAARFLGNRDSTSLKQTYVTATKWMLPVSLPLFLVFFFLPGHSLGLVYGAAYSVTTLPLRIVVIGAFVSSLFGPAAPAQIALGRTHMVLLNTLVAAGADVGLSLALIPEYGSMGAAIAWSVSTVLFPLLSTIELGFLEGLHPFGRRYVLPLLGTGIPVGLFLALVRWNLPDWQLPILTLAIAALFIVIVLVTRSVDRGDRLLLEAVERALGRRIPLVRRLGRLLAGNAVTSI
jgi:O-antigen/teichoic acid export membrane protein